MKFQECLDKGLIKRDPTAVERVENSLKIAERFLKSVRKNIEINEYEMAESQHTTAHFIQQEHFFLRRVMLKGAIIVLALR